MARTCCACLVVIWVCLKVAVIDGQGGTLGFFLNGVAYPNGSTVLRTDIGIDDAGLQCTTNGVTCCTNTPPEMRSGEFYYANGELVPIKLQSYDQGYYRSRGSQLIRLNRWDNGTVTGQFHCEIPDASGANVNLFINVVDINVSIASYGSNLTGGEYSLVCSAFVNGSSDQLSFAWLTPDNDELSSDLFNTTNNSSTLTLDPLSTSHAGTYTCIVTLEGIEIRENFTVEIDTGVSLSFRGAAVPNNSYVDASDIGEGDLGGVSDAVGLLCLTNKIDCCAAGQVDGGETLGEWYFPNGTIVRNKRAYSNAGSLDFFYRNRFQSVVRLLQVGHATERGLFYCEIPNANNMNHTLYVNLVNISPTPTASATLMPSTTFDSTITLNTFLSSVSLTPSSSPTPPTEVTVSILTSGGHTAGEVLTLTCSAMISGSSDQPNITWLDTTLQNVAQRDDSTRTTVSPTAVMGSNGTYSKSLSFNPLVESDAGIYTCRVTLGEITRTETATVTVNDTILRISDSNVGPQVIGQNYSLRCHILNAVNFDYTFRWKKGGTVLSEVGPDLSFSQLRLSDAGQYTCELMATVTLVSSLQLNITLQVPAPGVAVAAVQPVTPYNGTAFSLMGTMQLDESVIDIDVVATWEWSLSGRTLRHERTSSVLHPTVLTFQPLATNSSGEYSLNLTLAPLNRSDFIIESRVGTMYSLNVLPLPDRPPSISIISRHSSPSDECGEAMALNCVSNPVEGLVTPPSITWIGPAGQEVPTAGSNDPKVDVQTRNLIFNDVTTNNRGVYVCRVVLNIPEALIANHFDESSFNVNITSPGRVQSLNCTSRSSTNELQVSWKTPATQSGDVVDYRLEVNQLQLGSTTRQVITSVTKNETAIISGLSPQVPYNITVKSRNSAGCGEEAQVFCFTQEGVPPPPSSVTAVRVNSTAIMVSWTKLTLVELKGLAHYIVTYTSSQASGSTTVPWTNNSVIISNLRAGVQYSISVQTVNSGGRSAPVEIRTQDEGNTSTNLDSDTVNAIVGGVLTLVAILVVAIVFLLVLNFALKIHRQKAVDLSRRPINSPFMKMNDFYESGECRTSGIELVTADTGYATIDKYNEGFVDHVCASAAPQPYEEVRHRFPHPLPPSQQPVQPPSLQRYEVAQCPLYASAATVVENKKADLHVEETSFSREKECSDNVEHSDGISVDDERYVVGELHSSEAEAAYSTVKYS